MTLFQDIGLIEVAAEDLTAFAAGQPVSKTVDGYSVSAVLLPNGPVAPYTVFSGNALSIIMLVLGDYAAIAAGGPISIAEKVGNTWYGETITPPSKTTVPAVP